MSISYPTGRIHKPTQNYVYNASTLQWEPMTQPGGGSTTVGTVDQGAAGASPWPVTGTVDVGSIGSTVFISGNVQPVIPANPYISYTFTAPDTGAELAVDGMGSLVAQLVAQTGGFAESLSFQGSNDGGVTWTLLPFATQNGTSSLTWRTGIVLSTDTYFQANIAGWSRVRLQIGGSITGTATWTLTASPGSAPEHGTRLISADGNTGARISGGGALYVDPSGTSITVRAFDSDGSNPSTDVYQMAGQYNDALAATTVGRVAAFRASKFRALHTNLRDNNGVEVATSTAAPGGSELGLITRNIPNGTQNIQTVDIEGTAAVSANGDTAIEVRGRATMGIRIQWTGDGIITPYYGTGGTKLGTLPFMQIGTGGMTVYDEGNTIDNGLTGQIFLRTEGLDQVILNVSGRTAGTITFTYYFTYGSLNTSTILRDYIGRKLDTSTSDPGGSERALIVRNIPSGTQTTVGGTIAGAISTMGNHDALTYGYSTAACISHRCRMRS
jgi:hypothetical protein